MAYICADRAPSPPGVSDDGDTGRDVEAPVRRGQAGPVVKGRPRGALTDDQAEVRKRQQDNLRIAGTALSWRTGRDPRAKKRGWIVQAFTGSRAFDSCFSLSREEVRSGDPFSFDSDMSLHLLAAWATRPSL